MNPYDSSARACQYTSKDTTRTGDVMSDTKTSAELEDTLLQIRKAKTAHLRWRAYAMALSSGYSVEEGQLPVQHTECQFGGWYYGEGQALNHYQEFRDIEDIHQQVHTVYQEIFQTLFDKPEPSIWRKLMGKSATTDRVAQKVKIEKELERLSEQSRLMMDALDKLENVISQNN